MEGAGRRTPDARAVARAGADAAPQARWAAPGQWYLGINRRGLVVWPTRSVLTDVEPGRLLAWDTATSGARWVWELAPHAGGTRVVHRRPVPRRLTMLTRLFATLFLRGPSRHTDDLEQDMARSVANLQRAVETGS